MIKPLLQQVRNKRKLKIIKRMLTKQKKSKINKVKILPKKEKLKQQKNKKRLIDSHKLKILMECGNNMVVLNRLEINKKSNPKSLDKMQLISKWQIRLGFMHRRKIETMPKHLQNLVLQLQLMVLNLLNLYQQMPQNHKMQLKRFQILLKNKMKMLKH